MFYNYSNFLFKCVASTLSVTNWKQYRSPVKMGQWCGSKAADKIWNRLSINWFRSLYSTNTQKNLWIIIRSTERRSIICASSRRHQERERSVEESLKLAAKSGSGFLCRAGVVFFSLYNFQSQSRAIHFNDRVKLFFLHFSFACWAISWHNRELRLNRKNSYFILARKLFAFLCSFETKSF